MDSHPQCPTGEQRSSSKRMEKSRWQRCGSRGAITARSGWLGRQCGCKERRSLGCGDGITQRRSARILGRNLRLTREAETRLVVRALKYMANGEDHMWSACFLQLETGRFPVSVSASSGGPPTASAIGCASAHLRVAPSSRSQQHTRSLARNKVEMTAEERVAIDTWRQMHKSKCHSSTCAANCRSI